MERADLLDVAIEQSGSDVVATLSGELDHASAPGLRTRLDEHLVDASALTLVCDGLRFIDSAGLRLLLELHQELEQAGGRMHVVHPVEQVARSIAVTGLDVVLDVVPADPPLQK